jgi:hypothetical protein
MIDESVVLEQIENNIAMWCMGAGDSGKLARDADLILQSGVSMVSVVPDAVDIIWPWFEKNNIKILARFYCEDKKITDAQISELTVRIKDVFKRGAYGAQVFLRGDELENLVEQTHMVRDDLFFNKDLSIGLDITDVEASDWDNLFANLRKINATSVLFVCAGKGAKQKTEFVGALYAMLNAWSDDNKFDLHFALWPDFMRIEQAMRLTELMRPELVRNLKFFVNV